MSDQRDVMFYGKNLYFFKILCLFKIKNIYLVREIPNFSLKVYPLIKGFCLVQVKWGKEVSLNVIEKGRDKFAENRFWFTSNEIF